MTKFQYRLCIVLAALALGVAAGNAFLVVDNRRAQDEFNQRQALVQRGAATDGLTRELMRVMADAAVRGNDRDMRAALQRQGINLPEGSRP